MGKTELEELREILTLLELALNNLAAKARQINKELSAQLAELNKEKI